MLNISKLFNVDGGFSLGRIDAFIQMWNAIPNNFIVCVLKLMIYMFSNNALIIFAAHSNQESCTLSQFDCILDGTELIRFTPSLVINHSIVFPH